MSSRGAPLVPRRTPDKPRIEGFLAPRDVGKLRPSDSLAPGAFEAIRRGCSCDRLANDYGKGASNGFLADARRHVIDPHCPLHGSSIPTVPICTRCGKPIVREPGQRGRPPKYHPECRTPSEIVELQWKERNNERIRQEKRARDGAA